MGGLIDSLQFVFAPQVINGLSIGVAVILMALGLTIIFGLLDVINMAHGEFYALGAYLGLSLTVAGVNFWLLLLLVPLIMVPLGYVAERFLIQRVFHHKDRHILTLLLTFGLAIVLEDLYRLIYGAQAIKPEAPMSGATEVLGIFLPNYRMFLMAIGTAIIVAVWAVVYRTSLGAMVRAAAYDKNMSSSLGVPVGDHQLRGRAVDQQAHFGDLTRERGFIKQAVRDVAVEGIQRAKSVSRIRAAQILVHLPNDAAARDDKCVMDLLRQFHAFLFVVRDLAAKHAECIKPHGKVVKILTVAIRRFSDANAAWAPQDAINFRDQPFRLIKVLAPSRFGVQRGQQNDTEGICPQIPETVRPDALSTHSRQSLFNVAYVVVARHDLLRHVKGRMDRYPEAPQVPQS